MTRVRWVLFVAAVVLLLGGVVLTHERQQATDEASRMIQDSETEGRARFLAEHPRPSAESPYVLQRILALAEATKGERPRPYLALTAAELSLNVELSDLSPEDRARIKRKRAAWDLERWETDMLHATFDAEQAVRQSAEYVALERRREWASIGRFFGMAMGGMLGITWVAAIIPLLLRFAGIAYHKSAVTTVRGAVRSKRAVRKSKHAVRKHIRDIVAEATEDD